ncbi:response regulator [Thermodesulfobacteriota bacterium]
MDMILVIDDDDLVLGIISNLLNYIGYQVSTAGNGEEGIRLLNNTQPNLIITDINMPVMDGNSVAQYVRNSSTFKDTPIIAITGNSCDIKKGLFNNILTKPFKTEQLLYLIESLI